MKLKLLLLYLVSLLCLVQNAYAQNPLVKMWDKRFGGTSIDWFTCFQQTSDGGYILGGFSYSGIDGNKTQLRKGADDFWIVKIDSTGNKIWDKVFGSLERDELYSLVQCRDGGYLLGGSSHSGISGDKTEANWDITGDTPDYWIVKINSLGIKEWDKRFGGDTTDVLCSLQQTTDGGYILGGWSYSGISGNKTQASWGYDDYWIVKIDSLGNKQWDADFGGTYYDELYTLQQTSDGGYILGGYSASNIGGNKTQNSWGVGDYWVIKTDSIGNKQWDQDLGGTAWDKLFDLQQTLDGGYILGGFSSSGISGNKTQPTWGQLDYWIVKIDSLGTKKWDKDFGGIAHELNVGSITQTFDGGYLIAGISDSPISGTKSENNLGMSQGWILKTDSLGKLQWDKTLFTFPDDGKMTCNAIQTRDGCYVIAKGTIGGIAGYKTEDNWDTINGSTDYWIIKFCDSTILQSLFTSPILLCPGTCIDFLNLSFNANSYLWNFPGAVPVSSIAVNPTNICYANPGSYDVQLIATNANGSDTLLLTNYITVSPSPPPQSIIQSGDTLFANAGAASYQWYFNGIIINGATDYFYVAPQSGDYNVVATDVNGCEVEAAIFNVIASQFEVSGVRFEVFPNPVREKLAISSGQLAIKDISIYDPLGKLVLISSLPTANWKLPTEFDVSQLIPGMYFLEMTSGTKTSRTKFIKQ